MASSVTSETTLLDAFGIQMDATSWKSQKLSFGQKMIKLISDCAIKLFATVLGVKLESRNVKALSHQYDTYTSALEQNADLCRDKKVILVLHIRGSIPTNPKHFQTLEKQSEYKVVFKETESVKEANDCMA